MKTSARFLLFFTLLVISIDTIAQRGHGSLYSYFGVGTYTYDNFGMAKRLGGVGSAVRSPYFLNGVNPASQNSLKVPFTFLFEGEMTYNHQTTQTQTESLANNFSNLDFLQFWFKVAPKSTISLGLSPISLQDYSFSDVVYFEGVSERYSRVYKGWGNTNKVYLNFATSLHKRFSIGLRPSFIFSNYKKESTYLNINENGFLSKSSANASGVGLEGGIQLDLISKTNHTLTWGLNGQSYTGISGLSSDEISTFIEGEILYGSEEETISYTIPQTLRTGLAYQSPKWLLAMDYLYGFGSKKLENSVANQVYSFGVEYVPDYFGPSLWNTMSFSLGGNYNTGAVQVNGRKIKSYSVNSSVGLPLNRTSRVTLGYQYKTTGTREILAGESLHSITLNFSFGDRWFQKYIFE